ncbi:WUSCHEL-related homeobox 9-like isoform X2 [Amaranthus tricolor]|uniref:WUSCHEL-related homeobox 9-like isoform X2 n=1 Tax=Amaranthus tricolor TaxID=29722 RepID=UPI0025865C67|nr:WUSCHEL-related homeobox 9-like isoform X2 [Amaranthus tricolor]
MASSNRHWPSMFKSKPCNNQQWSQHQDTSHHPSSLLASNNTSNTTCARSSSITAFPFSSGCEERSPEPKPRWNPKPEQIRILEAIFNSGMVNPPRDEIRRIRAQLLEYGQVGDANVFYWFQNRKSRSKHKQRTLQAKINATALSGSGTQNSLSLPASSSSSSSDKASPQKAATLSGSGGGSSSYGSASSGNNYNSSSANVVVDQFGNSPTSVNQPSPYFHPLVPHPHPHPPPHHHHHHVPNTNTTTTTTTSIQDQPLFFPLHQNSATVMGNFSQGLCFGTTTHHHYEDHHHPLHQITTPPNLDVLHHSDQTVGGFSSLLLGDDEVEKLKFQHQLSFLVTNPSSATTNSPSPAYAFPNSLAQILGVGDTVGGVAPKSTVYINGMAVEIPVGHVNVKEFGESALLVNTETGEAVATNEWGVTLDPLHHAASYYLVNGTSGSGAAAASLLLHHKHDDDASPDVLASGFPYQI